MAISIESILIDAAEKKIGFDEINGIEPGHNGPYFDKESAVRNTAHWLIVFCCLFKRTGDKKYELAAYKAINYLKSPRARPMSAAFYCRMKKEKDFCNGVMGQAWVIEALLYAHKVLGENDLYNLAEEVFLLHDFDPERSIWYRLNVDGSRLSFDGTYNHQLWFAAVGCLFYKTPKILAMCDDFFEKIGTKPSLYSNGVIYHNSSIYQNHVERSKGIKPLLDHYLNRMSNFKQKKSLYLKSVGYHGFNLYAYELLKVRYKQHPFYKSPTYQRIISVLLTSQFKKDLFQSSYSYAYNPPGFENGFALIGNGYNDEIITDMLSEHFKITKNVKFYNSAVSEDKETSEARLYELVRILDINNIKFELNEN